MRSPCCLLIPPINLRISETWYVYHGNWAHLKSLPSVRVSVCVSVIALLRKGSAKCIPLFGAWQRLGKHVPAANNIRYNRLIVRRVIFCAVCTLSKESLWVCMCVPPSLLGNNSVNTFPRQRRIVGGVVFYAVRVVSKQSRRLVLPRTPC
jgi:hypothetical protein